MKVLKMTCPNCKKVNVVEEESANNQVFCSFCGNKLIISKKEEDSMKNSIESPTPIKQEKQNKKSKIDLTMVLNTVIIIGLGVIVGLLFYLFTLLWF